MQVFLEFCWNVLKWPLLIVTVVVCLFYFLVLIYYLFAKRKYGVVKPERAPVKQKKFKFLRAFLYELPHQIALDKVRNDPNEFPYHGIVMFEGKQGAGKTISMVKYATDMLEAYPEAYCLANFDYNKRTKYMRHWKEIHPYNNGKKGNIVMIDEIQLWFNSKMSKDLDPNMLQNLCQNRKEHRIMLCSNQKFYMVAKDIRTQCTQVRSCTTLFGCLTIVRVREPEFDSDGSVLQWHPRGWYWYVQSDALRESYDTRQAISALNSTGFQERVPAAELPNIHLNIVNQKKCKK